MKYINKILVAGSVLLGISSVFAAVMPHAPSSHSSAGGQPHPAPGAHATGGHNVSATERPQIVGQEHFSFCSKSCTENCASQPGIQQQCQQRCGGIKDQVASAQLSRSNPAFKAERNAARKKSMLSQAPIYKCMGGAAGMPGAMGAAGADVSNMDCNSAKTALLSEIDKLKMIVQSGGAGAGGAQHAGMPGSSHSNTHGMPHGAAGDHITATRGAGGRQQRQGPQQPRGQQPRGQRPPM